MRNEVIEKLKDPEVAAGVLDAGSEAEIVQVLGTAQVQVTPEEAQTILDGKRQLILGAVGSLTGDELAKIAGGMKMPIDEDEMLAEVSMVGEDKNTSGSKIVETMSKPGKWIGSKLPGKAGEFVNEHPIATTTAGGLTVLALGTGVATGAGIGIYKLIKKVKEKKAKKI